MSLLSWVTVAYLALFTLPLLLSWFAPRTDAGRDATRFFRAFGTTLGAVYLGFAFADLMIHLGTL